MYCKAVFTYEVINVLLLSSKTNTHASHYCLDKHYTTHKFNST